MTPQHSTAHHGPRCRCNSVTTPGQAARRPVISYQGNMSPTLSITSWNFLVSAPSRGPRPLPLPSPSAAAATPRFAREFSPVSGPTSSWHRTGRSGGGHPGERGKGRLRSVGKESRETESKMRLEITRGRRQGMGTQRKKGKEGKEGEEKVRQALEHVEGKLEKEKKRRIEREAQDGQDREENKISGQGGK